MTRETADLAEVRFSTPDDDGAIEAVAVRFDTVDTYRTTFDRQAFGDLSKRVPMLWSHDRTAVIGSWSQFTITDQEIRAKGRLNLEVERAREVRAMLANGDIDGASIGFRTLKDERRSGGIRHITQAQLVELSLVAFASVPGAKVTSVRNLAAPAETAAFIEAVRRAAASLKR
jgi:HK97 family phage prohead protease